MLGSEPELDPTTSAAENPLRQMRSGYLLLALWPVPSLTTISYVHVYKKRSGRKPG